MAAVSSMLLPMVEKKPLPIRYPEFSKRLQKCMEDAVPKISVPDITKRLKVTPEMARRYCLGQAMPRHERLDKLAKMLGVTRAYLAFEEGGEEPFQTQKGADNERPVRDESRADKFIEAIRIITDLDDIGIEASLQILRPIHDRFSRPELKKKRK